MTGGFKYVLAWFHSVLVCFHRNHHGIMGYYRHLAGSAFRNSGTGAGETCLVIKTEYTHGIG